MDREECLIQNAAAETVRAGHWKVQLELDLASALSLVGNLQLALRHPLNCGPSAKVARDLIDDLRNGLKARGFVAHAELIELGDDPAHDYDPRPAAPGPRLAVVPREKGATE